MRAFAAAAASGLQLPVLARVARLCPCSVRQVLRLHACSTLGTLQASLSALRQFKEKQNKTATRHAYTVTSSGHLGHFEVLVHSF